jgi:hypothetical protein
MKIRNLVTTAVISVGFGASVLFGATATANADTTGANKFVPVGHVNPMENRYTCKSVNGARLSNSLAYATYVENHC